MASYLIHKVGFIVFTPTGIAMRMKCMEVYLAQGTTVSMKYKLVELTFLQSM